MDFDFQFGSVATYLDVPKSEAAFEMISDSANSDAESFKQVVSIFKEKLAAVETISMIAFPADLTIEGDRATGKAYCRELIFTKGGDQKILIGCFHDEYVRCDGEWLFLARNYEVIGLH